MMSNYYINVIKQGTGSNSMFSSNSVTMNFMTIWYMILVTSLIELTTTPLPFSKVESFVVVVALKIARSVPFTSSSLGVRGALLPLPISFLLLPLQPLILRNLARCEWTVP